MAMIFVDARRDGDMLIVRAHSEYHVDRIAEARVEIGAIQAKPEEVRAGLIVATVRVSPGIWVGDWHIRASANDVAEVYALLGVQPLAAVPECPWHRYQDNTMQEIAVGVWRCSKCAPAEAPAASPDSPQQEESMAQAIGLGDGQAPDAA